MVGVKVRKIFRFLGLYLVGKETFLTSFGLWENFQIFGFWTSQVYAELRYGIKNNLVPEMAIRSMIYWLVRVKNFWKQNVQRLGRNRVRKIEINQDWEDSVFFSVSASSWRLRSLRWLKRFYSNIYENLQLLIFGFLLW